MCYKSKKMKAHSLAFKGYFKVKTGLGLDNEGPHTVGKITNMYQSKPLVFALSLCEH